MITEDYVSFEIAKLLKEKGFNGNTSSCYILEDSTHHIINDKVVQNEYYKSQDSNEHIHLIQAPTLQMAMKWIRDKYKILISPYALSLGWYFEIFDLANTDISGSKPLHKVGIPSKEEVLDSYEKACEAAIKLTLVSLVDKEDKDTV